MEEAVFALVLTEALRIYECSTSSGAKTRYGLLLICQFEKIKKDELIPDILMTSDIPEPHVKAIGLGGDKGSSMHTLTSDVCETFPNVELLEGSSLGLKKIQKDAFTNCTKLVGLNLESNHFTKIDPAILKPLQSLKFLALNDNFLRKIDANVFNNLPNLKAIHLANNHLKALPFDEMNPSDKLYAIAISCNHKMSKMNETELQEKFPNLGNEVEEFVSPISPEQEPK